MSLVAEAPEVAVAGLGSPPPRLRAVGFAPRPTAATWPETRLGRGDVVKRLTSAPFAAGRPDLQRKRTVGVELLVDWLSEQPGGNWQQRWLGVEADIAGRAWSQVRSRWLAKRAQRCSWHQDLMAVGLRVAISAEVIRPSLRWLVSGATGRGALVRILAASRDPEGFARLRAHCQADRALSPWAQTHVSYRSALIMAAKGGTLADITVGDVLELFDAETAAWGKASCGTTGRCWQPVPWESRLRRACATCAPPARKPPSN